MLFSSTVFLFFFLPFNLFVYYAIFRKNRIYQNRFLFFSSLLFYAWGEPFFVFLMLTSILLNWKLALYIDSALEANQKQSARHYLLFSLILNFSLLFTFKYLSFFISIISSVTHIPLPNPSISLPIGISFFTFQAVSYVIDVYCRQGIVQKELINVGLYISFFPQLIAGPIVRYQSISDQIQNRHESFSDFSSGTVRFIIGLSKKTLLANTIALVADKAFSMAGSLSVIMAWLGAIAYTFQIYFDFSAYSDMAIGLGRMFGFHFVENFNHPYVSKSISEFWRRWHISLGSWFRDYVYFPLGGSRVKSRYRLVFNLFVVWSLTGLWHGANWTFIVWGLFYFSLIAIEKLFNFEKVLNRLPVINHVYTLFFVIIGWVLFRSDSLSIALQYIGNMFGSSGLLIDRFAIFYFKENLLYFLCAFLASIPLKSVLSYNYSKAEDISQISCVFFLFLLFCLSVVYIVKGTYNPFIYFNF